MTTRLRWFRLSLPNGGDALLQQFEKVPFDIQSPFGFSRIESSASNCGFRFLWRTSVVVTKTDENGAPFYDEVNSISFVDFDVYPRNGKYYLRLENPSRNVRELLNALESLTGFGFTCTPITFIKSMPASLFRSVEVTKLVGLKVGGLALEEGLVARMEFASKEGIEIDQIKMLSGLKYKVESASYEILYESIKGQISFSSSGLVKVSGRLAPRIIHLIEEDII